MKLPHKINKRTGQPWTPETWREYRRKKRQTETRLVRADSIEYIPENDYVSIANGDNRAQFNLGEGCRRIVPRYQY